MKKNPKFLFLLLLIFSGCVTMESDIKVPLALSNLDSNVTQAIFVENDVSKSILAKTSAWQKLNGEWVQVIAPVHAVVGRNGLAAFNEKREGDGRTPSGIFSIQRSFGYDLIVPTGLDYRQVSEKDFWIDDVNSSQYNQWVRGNVPEVSHEKLKRDDHLYKYAIVIEYNTEFVVSGKGSAIFMHIWRGPDQATAGCVAMSEKNILRFLKWLDFNKNPTVIIQSKLYE